MRKLIFALALLCTITAQGQQLFTAPLPHWQGQPTGAPSSHGSRVRYDLLANDIYTWVSANSTWSLYSKGIDRISGTIPPAYTPNAGQSDWAVNGANPPELYYHNGSTWLRANPVSADAQTLSWNGSNGELSISGGNTVDLDGRYLTAEVDGSTTNELQTLSQVSNTVTLSNGGGTVNVDPSVTNELQTISRTGQTVTLSQSGGSFDLPIVDVVAGSDISVSISGGVATVSATGGGGVTWPLLAPDGDASAPSYSFENAQASGMYLSNRGEVVLQGVSDIIKTFNVDEGDAGALRILSGDSNDPLGGNGGRLTIVSGNSPNGSGGTFELSAGTGVNGGNFNMQGGDATTGNGGGFTARAGNSEDGGGGAFYAAGGFSNNGGGGELIFEGGGSNNSTGGGATLKAGAGDIGGAAQVIGGTTNNPSGFGGDVVLQPGEANSWEQGGKVSAYGTGLVFPNASTAQRNAIASPSPGQVIWNTTTTKLQVYTGSAWADLH